MSITCKGMEMQPRGKHKIPSLKNLERESEDANSNKEHEFWDVLRHEHSTDLCWVCGKLLNSATSLKVHLRKHNVGKSCRDPIDDEQSSADCSYVGSEVADGSDSDGDSEEGQTKIPTSDNLCWVCGKLLNSTKSLRMHLQTHNEEISCLTQSDDRWSLTECSVPKSKVAESYKDWKESEGSDSDEDETNKGSFSEATTENWSGDCKDLYPLKYCCKVCGRFYRFRASFLKHVQEDEKDTDLCGVCGEHFWTEEGLRLHLQTYNRKNECRVCGRHFDGPKKLEIHARSHTREKPYGCSICGKTFTHDRSVKEHMRSHTGEKPHVCSVCAQCFSCKGYLLAHMRIHTGEKPFLCSVCGKGFRLKGNLKTHMLIHTGESAHRCLVCDKSFYLSETLKIHMRTHTGERPYLCNVCGKSFSVSCSLTKHMVVHGGERTHCCYICRKRFLRKEELRRHIQTHRNLGRHVAVIYKKTK
ncbi:Zinc finger protein 709 [Channa argus]|uniref:Zinc finger protein 709 n=1 Tax=Channa argus TaxID=215402 RepID=A0A6G1QNM5_CHAAH|nr:Zinc finger protein 709 [Channa argus]KAK2884515.1 hypothetical protein Q8A73_020989 [Channa argus]